MEKIRQRAREVEARRRDSKKARLLEQDANTANEHETVQEKGRNEEEVVIGVSDNSCYKVEVDLSTLMQQLCQSSAAVCTQWTSSPSTSTSLQEQNNAEMSSQIIMTSCFQVLLTSTLLHSMLNHLLYSLALCPMPLLQLRSHLQQLTSDRPKLSLAEKKLKVFTTSLEMLLEEVKQSLAVMVEAEAGRGMFVTKLCVLLGPSISNTKRAFILNMHIHEEGESSQGEIELLLKKALLSPTRERAVDRIRRLLTQQLVNHFATAAEDLSSAHVSGLARGNIFLALQTSLPIASSSQELVSKLPLRLFRLASSFEIRQRQRRGAQPLHVDVLLNPRGDEQKGEDSECYWLVQRKGLKALRSQM